MGNNKKHIIIRKQVNMLGRPPIAMLKREIARQERKEAYGKLARGILVCLAAAAAVSAVVTNLWLAMLRIDGPSMEPLLQTDEIVLAARSGNPARNDIIAFYHNNRLYVKRVIAMAGDIVDIGGDGAASVNGERLDEPYAAALSLGSGDIPFPFHVPAGTVFVMGDNRPVSMDSRDSRFGPVSRDQIVGKVHFRIWPLSRIGSIP